ncbi:MAG TPA: hypothetical protein DDW17_03180 [Deltaproteobacteria bacterium]|nr:hypothetical protein [Deltaproteobacteria bacterium]
MSELNKLAEEIVDNCLECGLCLGDCEFLGKYFTSPKELVTMYKDGNFSDRPEIPYSCCICNLCEEICPQNLNSGKMCLLVREELVDEGIGPLPQHQLVKRTQEFVLSDAFRLVQADLKAGKCERVFFPGCSLSGYSPSLVKSSYMYLKERLSNIGIILGCCGGPNHFIGEVSPFKEILGQIKRDMEKLGASEIIVACPDCYRTFKENLPEIRLKSIYEAMVEMGLPSGIKLEDWTFSLHDSCTARWEKSLQDSVRELIKRLNYEIEDVEYSRDKARCCGMGGMVPFVDFELAANITRRRLNEFHFDIVTYCAACREAFALERPAIHILDLIFNPDWQKTKHNLPKTGKKRREAQLQTKAILLEMVEKENI